MRTCLQCGQNTESLYCPADGMATVVEGVRPPPGNLEINTVFAGRYRITGLLGRGGMGAVYAAQHTGTGQAVAVKTLLLDTDADTDAVRRFFNEARLTAGLQHPNTIRVFDFGQSDEGTYFIAMECLRGESLADRQSRLKRQGQTVGEAEAVRMAVAVLRSLTEAHRVGLVHRDLKPANIYLHEIGGGETVVKVLDFGIAKTADSSLTRTGTSLGTPSYMSPEQVMGHGIDGRSDLYALGIVMYGCVAGELPFLADSSYSMMMKHVAEAPPDLCSLENIAVSPGFAAIVERALAKRPADRFQDAAAMREALEALDRPGVAQVAALPPQTPAAPPATRPERPQAVATPAPFAAPPVRAAAAAAPPRAVPAPPAGRAQTGPGLAAVPGPSRQQPPAGAAVTPGQRPAPVAAVRAGLGRQVPPASGGPGRGAVAGIIAAIIVVIGGGIAGLLWQVGFFGAGEVDAAAAGLAPASQEAPATAPAPEVSAHAAAPAPAPPPAVVPTPAVPTTPTPEPAAAAIHEPAPQPAAEAPAVSPPTAAAAPVPEPVPPEAAAAGAGTAAAAPDRPEVPVDEAAAAEAPEPSRPDKPKVVKKIVKPAASARQGARPGRPASARPSTGRPPPASRPPAAGR